MLSCEKFLMLARVIPPEISIFVFGDFLRISAAHFFISAGDMLSSMMMLEPEVTASATCFGFSMPSKLRKVCK